jgi:hypothetical protein
VVKVNSRHRHNKNINITSNNRRVRQLSGGPAPSPVPAAVTRKLANSRRRWRVFKMAVFIHLLLVSAAVLLAWLGEPSCCDSYTAISFGPQLRYVNGPPPI